MRLGGDGKMRHGMVLEELRAVESRAVVGPEIVVFEFVEMLVAGGSNV